MPKVAVLARIRAKEGKGDEVVAVFKRLLEQVEKEAGTLLYAINRSNDDPNVFWVSELYADDEAFAAHAGSEAMAEAGPAFGPVIAETELILGEPVLTAGPGG